MERYSRSQSLIIPLGKSLGKRLIIFLGHRHNPTTEVDEKKFTLIQSTRKNYSASKINYLSPDDKSIIRKEIIDFSGISVRNRKYLEIIFWPTNKI